MSTTTTRSRSPLSSSTGLGYVYGEAEELERVDGFDGRIGSRVPHAWVALNGTRIFTLDLFGRDFAILAHGDGGAKRRV